MTETVASGAQRYAPPLSAWRGSVALVLGIVLFAGLLVFLGWLGLQLHQDGWQVGYFVFFGLLFATIWVRCCGNGAINTVTDRLAH